ncbi:LysM peptidoglycan-binding domain-containing protein [sulfur-oxidizing endosymbiont of Gigantopelta aegis]|uniref:LysM peptidoglycan-binding domain-containing protein n=1 Tax=sulfur-oxidizing endosymbiont of Gigantopelta aegis TaxID=2794934 RepID=UPI0018DE5EAB|nr:LysM domain-containing protein [sulfur-oxidizing endosymbiont of Gigantopelta aegis]
MYPAHTTNGQPFGNPDRPLISGRTYNGDSLPPYSLPANKTRRTLKTHSTPGGEGYNEIRYEDKKAQEQIYFHSEKDLDIRCKNDRREHIENTRSLIVENEQHEHIKVDNHQKITNNHQHKVGNNLSQTIGQKLHIKAGSKILQSAGSEVHIKAASSIKLDAGSEITFKAGSSFIKIDPSGVTISGPKVNLNSGGGPGSASSAAPINPFQAVEADKDKPGQSFKPIAPEAPYQLSQFKFSKNMSGGAIKFIDRSVDLKQKELNEEKEEITELYFSYLKPVKPEIHEVKKGETLSEIAQKYGINPHDIASINNINIPYTIYPEQQLIISKIDSSQAVETKLNGRTIPLGEKVNIIAKGTKNATATINVLADEIPFKVLKNNQEVSSFEVTFDDNGQSVTEIELRPKSRDEYKQLITQFSPQLGKSIVTKKLTLKAEINKPNFQTSLINDDMNTLGLNLYQTYIKSAYVVDPKNGQVHTKLNISHEGDMIVFTDAITGEPIEKTALDDIVNSISNINNGLGGLAAGMEYVGGTFTLTNSKGINLAHYESAWGGNQYVKTYSMSSIGKRLSQGTLAISLTIGVIQINSAYQTDSKELVYSGLEKPSPIKNIGQHTEQQVGSTALGIASGLATGAIAIFFLPAEAGVILTLGAFIVVGSAVGWVVSLAGSKGVEEIQKLKGSTIINDYSLHKHPELE